MIITKKCKIINKIQLLINLVRAEEALATLIEQEYDFEEESKKTIEALECQGIKCELSYNNCGYTDRRAIAERNIKDYEYRRAHCMDWNGLE